MAITSFLGVFEERLSKTTKKIDKELAKAKHERDRKLLKGELKIAKGLKKTVKTLRNELQVECPHCGGMFHPNI